MDILHEFNPHALAAARAKNPDETLFGARPSPWPALDGVVAVLFASRSGSTALTRIAERNFLLGQAGESLNVPILEARGRKHDPDEAMQDTLKRVIADNSEAGWFVVKTGVPGLLNGTRLGFFAEYGPLIRPVLLLRRDGLGQALSIFAAKHTRRYHSTQQVQHELSEDDYDAAEIQQCLQDIVSSNDLIIRLLPHFTHPARVLFYEDFASEDEDEAIRILAATGLPQRPEAIANPRREVHKITHPLTPVFRERFLAKAGWRARRLLAQHERTVARWHARREKGTA